MTAIDLNTIISAKLVAYCDGENLSKRKVLEQISRLVCEFNHDVKQHTVLDALQQRERLGNTAIGNGLAIPHARIEGIRKPMCIILSLRQTVNFDPDAEQPANVDLVFCLLVPGKKDDLHLDILAALTKKLSDSSFVQQLRDSHSSEELYQTVTNLL